jgi:MFS family permease
MTRERKNVILLAVCQALFMTSQTSMIIVAGLVGYGLLGAEKALATLPVSAAVIGVAVATIPASLLMKRIGRRAGFIIGNMIGVVGGLLAAYAINISAFPLFVGATFIIGCSVGFSHYYRFAAADAASPAFRSRAISLVVAGGVVSAFVSPSLVRYTTDLTPVTFMGTYLAVVGITLATAVLLLFLDIPPPTEEEAREPGRPLSEIARQPAFIVAILAGMISYGVMNLVMTATPLAMIACGFDLHDAAQVIQWHVVGMFAPAFFTGALIHRFGVLNIMLIGTVLLLGCTVAALMGIAFTNFVFALTALGLGWNFTFIGATTLLTQTYQPAEKAKAQATHDFLVFGTNATASLSSGALLHFMSWNAVHIVAFPMVLIATLAVAWLALRRRSEAAAGA